MRIPDRTRRRSPKKKGNKGCAVAAVFGVIVIILLSAFLFRSCVSGINNALSGIGSNITAQTYPIKYQNLVEKYSKKYDVDKYLVYAVIKAESKFDQYAVSQAGAYGLMQLQTETASDCAKKLDLKVNLPDDLYVPDKYEGDISLAIAAYNGGIGNVDSWLKDERYKDGKGGLSDIPFAETKNYVTGVNSAYQKYKELYE